MNWYLQVLKKYTVFSGRARRKEYWFFVLFNIIFSIAFGIIDGVTGTFDPATGMGMLGALYALAVLIPSLAVTVRRLHDTGRSGWWFFIILVPLLGVIIFLVFMFLDSKSEDNQYGANPKAELA